ncbi:MAG: hypothetical protein NUV80_01040 [Candidatus Berkelbacteria bacterium]|nr:hypothetical protein [Candidatus Berkelbacteria bacterium]
MKKTTKKETIAKVVSSSGGEVRVFTREEHGKRFRNLANQFVKKYQGNDFKVVVE